MHEYHTPRLATKTTYRLAEGPIWDPVRRQLLWVDILDSTVIRANFTRGDELQIEEVATFPDLAGAVAIAATGELLVAGRDRLYTRDVDGVIQPAQRLFPAGNGRRLNDGKPDPAGRFVVGSLSMTGDSNTETLMRVESDGSVNTIDDDLALSNGLAWSVDGTRMFSVDTNKRLIYVRSYDPRTGAAGPRIVFVGLTDGYPDGICIDAEDYLWVAVWGTGAVHRYSPEGALAGRIELPAPHPSSVAFAGNDLDILVITTATEGLTEDQLSECPLSGRLFTIKPGVQGPPPTLWAGTH